MCERINFKTTNLVVYSGPFGLEPKHISDILVLKETSSCLRPSETDLLCIPRIETKQGGLSFSLLCSPSWNKLPEYPRSAETVSSFNSELENLMFSLDF